MIIGLNGFAGSGKSEVARVLGEIGGFKRIPFAAPLKSMLEAAGFTHDQLWGGEKEVPLAEFDGRTPRYIMQTLGTEWGRDLIHPDFWVILWRRAVAAHGGNVVVDDVRFPNEVEVIKGLGGQVWRIERPGLARLEHVSESYELATDFTIVNAGTLEQFRHAVRRVYGLALSRAS